MGARTGEGGGAASLAFTVSCLIGAVPAVIAAVTQPLLGDTPVVLALKLGLRAELVAVGLILAVLTIVLFVTRPAHGDAAPAGAGKVIEWAPWALHTWAVTLVTVVSTVVGTIAHPAGCIAEGCPLARLEEDTFHAQAEITAAVGGAAIHLIRGILTIHKLVAATGVPDAGPIPAAEFTHAAGGLVARNLIGAIATVVHPIAPQHVRYTAAVVALAESLLAAA